MPDRFHRLQAFSLGFALMGVVVFTLFFPAGRTWAVTSRITHHADSGDLLKGEVENVVISSRGAIRLGRAAEMLIEEFEGVWSVNSIVVSGGSVYLGTSPNGGIYKYSLGELTEIYPAEEDREKDRDDANDANRPGGETGQAKEYLSNEHIFAMATDVAGRLLAGISGKECKLCRLEKGTMQTIFEPNDARYIFAIALDRAGNIYLGTGPEGKVYRTDPFGKKGQIVCDSRDKNILSLVVAESGLVYTGSDSRGLVYKVDPDKRTMSVLYDSDEPEVAALLFPTDKASDDGDLYAAATLAQVVETQRKFTTQLPSSGRPEVKVEAGKSTGDQESRQLKIANTGTPAAGVPAPRPGPVTKGAKPGKASHIYRISTDGFVTDVFSEAAVFFCLAEQAGKLLVGTGNDARLLAVDPESEEQAIVYEDEQAVQITAIAVSGDDVYLGTANPAKLVKLSKNYASEGTYVSDLIDAGQPAGWGKLQIDADIPKGCRVLVASRSGNVGDVNDPTFSDWTEPVEVTEPVQLGCPPGRFCQYKVLLQSEQGRASPIVREIAVAGSVPNLAPKVLSIDIGKGKGANKEGVLRIAYKARDDNEDKLIYRIDFRKIARENWIELEDDLEKDNFEWDSKTVEDGRYEIRVTAGDERSNTTTTKLTGSRISEPVVVDNTGPVIVDSSVDRSGEAVTLKLRISDEFSAIGELDYTVNSNEKWIATLPDDSVYDTMDESFTIVFDGLTAGEHIIAVRARDAAGNTTYKTFEVNIPGG